MSDIIVKTTGLCADFKIKDRMVRAVNRVSLSLERGKTLVILGESGSGKSTYMKALLRILPKTAAVEGQAEFLGNDLFRMSEKEFRDIRGNRMAMIYQDSLSALDPMYKVGYQIVETIRAHSSLTKAEARERVEELFVKVGIPSPRERMNAYPHEMSGGMRQMFGVCANEWATDDGAVVSLDHTCGSHSETDVPKNGTAWPVRPSRVNEGALDAEPMPHPCRRQSPSDEAVAEQAQGAHHSEDAPEESGQRQAD